MLQSAPMPDSEHRSPASSLGHALAAVGRSILWVLRLPLRLLALPFNRELSKLRSEIRAYGEGSLEATTMVGGELRGISRALEEELPRLQERIEILERELEEIRREREPTPNSPD
jgi:hypothetical protein